MAISLESIQRGTNLKPPKIVLYGTGGIGKTSFAASAPNPIFICTEEGQGALDITRFEPHQGDPVVRSWQEILDCIGVLYQEDHPYQTVVLDTLDFAEPLLHKHTADLHGKADIEAFGYAKGYRTYAIDQFRVFAAGLDALRNDRNMVILLLAHCDAKKFESPESDSYDRWDMRLDKNLAAFVHDWSDALLFANYKAHVVSEDAGFNKKRNRAVGQGERVIYTQERPAWSAKNRYSLPAELPLVMNNSWQVLQDAIAAQASATLPEAPAEQKVGT